MCVKGGCACRWQLNLGGYGRVITWDVLINNETDSLDEPCFINGTTC